MFAVDTATGEWHEPWSGHEVKHPSGNTKRPYVMWARRLKRIMLILASALVVGLLVLAAALLRVSPGKPAPFLDAAGKPLAGSISEKVHVDINGVRQGMFIKSRNAAHPVLLYVHGGMPDYVGKVVF